MSHRRAISPFIATVLLVAITISLGGVLYNQFRDTITSQIRTPSLSLADLNVASDRQTITLLVKNDGNVDFTISRLTFSYGSVNQNFLIGSNVTIISGSPTMKPGSLIAARFKVAAISLPSLSAFTITIVADQLARAFNIQS